MFTDEQIRDLQQALGKAYWNMNLDRFAEAIGSDPEHGYTQDRFRDFTTFVKALGRFTPHVLAKIINAASEQTGG